MLLYDGFRWFRIGPDGSAVTVDPGAERSRAGSYPGRDEMMAERLAPRRKTKKRKAPMARKSKKGKSHCKRVPVKKGSRKKRLMCWGANGKIVSAKRSKAGKKAARKRRHR